ncbi:MAG: L-threonylcarbamoyladenylate synthase [bacterium]
MECLRLPDTDERDAAARAAVILGAGGVIVFPAERLYGVGASALHSGALRKVLTLKKRGTAPLPVVVYDMKMAEEWIKFSDRSRRLAERFWPGPLTLVLESRKKLPAELSGGGGKLGVRVPGNSLAREIAGVLGAPYTATSGNISGAEPGRTAREAVVGLSGEVDLVLDAGELAGPPPSTVAEVSGDALRILREGAISASCLEDI